MPPKRRAPDPLLERARELRAAFAAGAQFQAHYVARDYPDGLYHEKPVMHEAQCRWPDAALAASAPGEKETI